jgi:hypothetical protein
VTKEADAFTFPIGAPGSLDDYYFTFASTFFLSGIIQYVVLANTPPTMTPTMMKVMAATGGDV